MSFFQHIAFCHPERSEGTAFSMFRFFTPFRMTVTCHSSFGLTCPTASSPAHSDLQSEWYRIRGFQIPRLKNLRITNPEERRRLPAWTPEAAYVFRLRKTKIRVIRAIRWQKTNHWLI